MNSSHEISPIDQLAKIYTNLSIEARGEKLKLLEKCSEIKLRTPEQIKLYHEILLFLLAYAENKLVYSHAKNEMIRVCEAARDLTASKKEQLTNSGIAFTETQGTFSFVMMKWLIFRFGDQITIHSFDETGLHPKDLLKHILNPMEFELIGDEELSKLKWLEKASGSKNKKVILKWLINSVDEIPLEPALKEQLFESLKLFITIQPVELSFSRSFGSVQTSDYYFHQDGLLKKFNESDLINKKLPPEKKLNNTQKEEILKTARIALILLNRETDPITCGTTDGIKVFNLEHGLSIVLFSINPQLRLAIESYIGFMMFKNGHPMSYGGAWLFGKCSLIGINIFEAFRGGESAFVFAQLLRTYQQAFGATHFEVEPYQFGKNNPEGLKSGAFWFYHRFGFRPVDKKLRELAQLEHQKINNTKGYRTPIEILKQFTKSNLEVNFREAQTNGIRPLQISHFISDTIARQFNGKRHSAFKWSKEILETELGLSFSKLSKAEQYGFIKLSVFAAFCLNLKKMTAPDKKTLIKLIKEKGTSEFEYALSVHSFPFEKYYIKDLAEFKLK